MTSVLSRHDQGLDQPCQTADAAFERLYAEHSDRILAYCLRRLPARAEAEDAVQLTFLYALRALRRGVVPEHASAWLHAIAKNVCRWQLRTAARRPLGDGDGVELLAVPEVDPEERELLAEVFEALESIPERQRRALLLREWRGLSAPEIAEHLELSTPATHALLTRARQSLQLALVASKRAALGAASLVYELRAWLKGVVGATSVKAGAVATVVVIGGAGGAGVSVDRSPASAGSTRPAFASEEASAEPIAAGVAGERDGAGAPAADTRGGNRSADARLGGVDTGPTGTLARLPGRSTPALTPWSPRGGPAPEPGAEPTPGPAPEADGPGNEPAATEAGLPPVDPPPLDPPEVDAPPVDLPPVDPPPIDVPTVDLPGDVLPPVEVPTVDPPPVDLPPVDLPPIDLPPLGG